MTESKEGHFCGQCEKWKKLDWGCDPPRGRCIDSSWGGLEVIFPSNHPACPEFKLDLSGKKDG